MGYDTLSLFNAQVASYLYNSLYIFMGYCVDKGHISNNRTMTIIMPKAFMILGTVTLTINCSKDLKDQIKYLEDKKCIRKALT